MSLLTEITLRDWKSFRDARLFIDQLSVLIGTNAGGKSNALDALIFLNRISTGSVITNVLQGDATQSPIRGGLDWAAKHPSKTFSIGAIIKADESTDYEYKITCEIHDNRCDVSAEELIRIKYRQKKDRSRGRESGRIKIFRTDPCSTSQPDITARLYNEKQGSPRQCGRSTAVLFQLFRQKYRSEITEGVNQVVSCFRGIFILDPIPSHMRGFSQLSENLDPDAGNIAGVIAARSPSDVSYFDEMIERYMRNLPEQEIKKIYAEKVGKFETDAMLYCEETWGRNQEASPIVDARGMSDGTLRFLAILTALLTRPRGTLLVVEEVDNGLHPSRSSLLLSMLRDVGEERGVDVLVTTHNPALLDEMGMEMVRFITVAHRNPDTGESELKLLDTIKRLPKILSIGPIGRLTSKGIIERTIREEAEQISMEF